MIRVAILILQLMIAAGAVLIASVGSDWINFIPSAIIPHQKSTDLTWAELGTIVAVFVGMHGVLLLVSWAFNRRHPFTSLRRCLVEIYFAVAGTSIASCSMFLFTLVPFSPLFYAWAYIMTPLLYLGGLLLFMASRAIAKQPVLERAMGGELGGAVRFVFSLWTPLAVSVALAPGVLAVAYKKDRNFADTVNYVRMSLNVQTQPGWQLADAWPGRRFEQPMCIRWDPTDPGAFYMLARPGRLYRYTTEPEWNEELVLDISDEVRSVDIEMGALSFDLHPEFGEPDSPNAGYAYIWYTHFKPGEQHNRLARFDLSPPDPERRAASRKLLIDLERPPSGLHNGGSVLFGPDGFLWFSAGDMSMPAAAQRIDRTLSAGVFRIDVDQRGGDVSGPIRNQPEDGTTQGYYIPKSNPWYGRSDALGEYWALGFRNPFRIWVDPRTKEVWLGDVGHNSWEEQNHVRKGDNGQWAYREGGVRTGRTKPEDVVGHERGPIYAYEQTAMDRAAIGGLIYRGQGLPELFGMYVFADNNSSTVWRLDPRQSDPKPELIAKASQFGQQGITSLSSDGRGNIYVTVLGSKQEPTGQILRLTRSDDSSPQLTGRSGGDEPTIKSVSRKFDAMCVRCHGEDGKGMPDFAAADEMKARPDFTSAEWQRSVTDQRIRKVIRKGGQAFENLSPDMPPWEGVFTNKELDLLVRKIRSFGPDEVRKSGADEDS